MAIFNPALLSQFRALSEGEMPDSFTVNVPGAFTSDGKGGGSYAVGTTRGPYSARVSSKADPREASVASRMEQEGLEMLTFPLGATTVAQGETGTFAYSDPLNGADFTFEVVAVVPTRSLSAHSKALIRRT